MGFMLWMYGAAMTISGRGESSSLMPPEGERGERELVAERTVAEIGIRLLDDAYSRWLVAESGSAEALSAWLGAAGRRREDAYCVYVGAVDREHAAACDLQRLSEIAAPSARVHSDVVLARLA
jgi:hypothetical protein